MKAKVVILAGGKGKRLLSEQHVLPKVMREAAGRPLLHYVLDGLSFLEHKDIIIVVGYKREKVIESIAPDYSIAVQEEQKGTAHAVEQAYEYLKDFDGPVLVCFGDMALLSENTYRKMIETHIESKSDCTILTAFADPPPRYGRIIRDGNGNFERIIEDHDLTDEQRKITEVNVGINIFDCQKMLKYLGEITADNAQGERYLPWLPGVFKSHGCAVNIYTTDDIDEIWGVNTPEDLELVEGLLSKK